jgi:DNA-binding beta-propeller fold protein YncE
MPSNAVNERRLGGLISVALALALAACQASVAASPSALVASAAAIAAPSTSPAASPSKSPVPSAPLPAHVIAQWHVDSPSFLAFAFGNVWVTSHFQHKITRIDPGSNTVAAVIRGTGDNPEDALGHDNALWVTGQNDNMVLIDPMGGTITGTIGGDHLYMDYGFGSVWITTRDNHLDRFDATTAEVTASIKVGEGEDDCMNDVQATPAAVWVISCDRGELIKVDPATNEVVSRLTWAALIAEAKARKSAPAGKGTDSIWLDVGGDSIAGPLPTGLLRVDPATGSGSAFLPLTGAQFGDSFNAVTDTAVWLAGTQQINRVDVATNRITATYPTGDGRLKIGVAYGSVWLRNFELELIQRLDYQP